MATLARPAAFAARIEADNHADATISPLESNRPEAIKRSIAEYAINRSARRSNYSAGMIPNARNTNHTPFASFSTVSIAWRMDIEKRQFAQARYP